MNKKVMTKEQTAHAVEWLLYMVDDMIEQHKVHKGTADGRHLGLCHLRSSVVYRRHGPLSKISSTRQDIINRSFSSLMKKHLMPNRHPTYWFGLPRGTANWNKRLKALQHLRTIIESGDINPY